MSHVKEIDVTIEKHKQHNAALVLGMTMAIEVAVSLEEYGETEKVAELEKNVREYIEMESQVGQHIAALAEMKNVVLSGLLDRDDDTELSDLFQKRLDQLAVEQGEINLKRHPKYREFRQKVWQVHHPNEALPEDQNSELVVMSQRKDDYICPITRKTLLSPVKNRNCGHYYSKNAIEEFLRSARHNGTKDCPVAGCSAKVSRNTLEEDPDLERRIMRMQKKKQQQAQEPEESEESAEDL